MIKATYADKKNIIELLCKSFDTNKSVNYVVKQDRKRKKRIRVLMDYSFEACWNFGEIYLSEDKKGVVLLLFPEKKKTNAPSVIRDIKLAIHCVGISNISKVLSREAKIKKYHPKKLIYIWYIGIDPDFQSQGMGSSLLKSVVELSEEKKLPVYLETSNERNLNFYNKHFFEMYNSLHLDHTLYMFRRINQT